MASVFPFRCNLLCTQKLIKIGVLEALVYTTFMYLRSHSDFFHSSRFTHCSSSPNTPSVNSLFPLQKISHLSYVPFTTVVLNFQSDQRV